MTITSTLIKNQYIANGINTIFSYTFQIQQQEDILVLSRDPAGVETVYVLNVDYTVTGAGSLTGGTIVFTVAPPNLELVTLVLNFEFLQLTDYNPVTSFPEQAHEAALDRLDQQDLQLLEAISRVALFPPSTSITFNNVLPDPTGHAGELLGVNSLADGWQFYAALAGTVIVNPFWTPILLTATSAAAAAALGVQQDVITTQGDLVRGNALGVAERLAIGAVNTVLTSNGTQASWQVSATGVITAEGDLIIGDAAALPVALPIGANTFVLTSNGTTATWAAPTAGSVATQAQMETATDLTAMVTPGRTQYHPGVAKARIKFNGTGVIAINDSYNVTSLTDNGVGDYSVNFTTNFSSGDYEASVLHNVAVNTTGSQIATMAAGSFRFLTISNTAVVDPSIVSVILLGDQ